MSKFAALYALASKVGKDKKFALRRKFDEEGTISLQMKGFPTTFTAADIKAHAETQGAKFTASGDIAEAVGKPQCTIPPEDVGNYIDQMLAK